MQMSGKNQKNQNIPLKIKIKSIFALATPDATAKQNSLKGILLHLKKASLTVEAAMAVPIFFMMLICIISIMAVYSQTLDKMTALRDSAETAAVAVLAASDEESIIELSEVIEFSPYFMPDKLSVVSIRCTGYARAWTGRSSDDSKEKGEEEAAVYVYVTESGTVYHTSSSCTHIKLSISSVSSSSVEGLRNSSGGKYKACEKCVGSSAAADTVYITSYGDRYHNSSACSGLKRTVKMVDLSTLSDMKECSRCASTK